VSDFQTENRAFFEHKMPLGLISLTAVYAKRLKLVPDFAKTLNSILQSKTNSF
jgi:hypothetical protein